MFRQERPAPSKMAGFTIIEMTVVIVILLILIGISVFTYGNWTEWQLGAKAGTELRLVHSAQKTYLSEHPTEAVSTLTADKIIPYLSTGATALPTVEDLNGNTLSIKVDVMPPVVDDGSAAGYDPSGSSSDGLWDVGD